MQKILSTRKKIIPQPTDLPHDQSKDNSNDPYTSSYVQRVIRQSITRQQENVIERRTLYHLLPDASSVLQNIFTSMQVQEPTFKSVIVLYRRNVELKDYGKGQRKEYKYQKRNIHIKSFEDIAMADLEMIFPQKKVKYKASTIITVLVTLIAALVAFIYMLVQEGSNLSFSVLVSSLSIFAGKIAQSYMSAEKERSDLQSTMNEMMYERVLDSQEGVMYTLIESMTDSFFKEILIVYTLLYKERLQSQGNQVGVREITEKDIEEKIEHFIENNFRQKVEFDIKSALDHMQKFRMIQKKMSPFNEEILEALPLQEAFENLQNQFQHSFTSKNVLNVAERLKSHSHGQNKQNNSFSNISKIATKGLRRLSIIGDKKKAYTIGAL